MRGRQRTIETHMAGQRSVRRLRLTQREKRLPFNENGCRAHFGVPDSSRPL